ncbi:MAG: DUF4129 domain-containing protein [Halobacteriales archaeon]|nr:DUF4129 domain-containing protein [Halobacteriales archaeon]
MASVRTRPLVIALVAILAIALAAATLNTAVVHEGSAGAAGGGGFGQGVGEGQGQTEGDSGDPSSFGFSGFGGAIPVIPFPCYPFLNELWFFAGAAAVVGLALYGLYRRKGPLVPIGVVAAFGPPALLVHALLTACRSAEDVRLSLPFGAREANSTGAFSLTSGQGGAGAAAGGTPIVSVALALVLGLALIVAVALLFQSTGDDQPPAREAEETPDPVQMAAIGRAAGRAADRIEGDAEPDNAVFEAWKEMTDGLDVPNPEASTPSEFALAADDAGMAREDVRELTELFESVRYGTAEPTAEREERAVAALRRIEDEYAGEPP